MTHKQVLIVRKDLNMRKGKIAAQAAHASLAVILNHIKANSVLHCGSDDFGSITTDAFNDPRVEPWVNGAFKKICVSVNSEAELLEIHQKAKDAGILTALIQDSGLTEFGGVPTYTTVAVGPDSEEKIDTITKHLPLL